MKLHSFLQLERNMQSSEKVKKGWQTFIVVNVQVIWRREYGYQRRKPGRLTLSVHSVAVRIRKTNETAMNERRATIKILY